MSEEEILEEIKSLSPSADAIQGILDLYNKQKEKNKKLEEERTEIRKKIGKYINRNDNYISKDKIREIVDIYDKDFCEFVKLPNGEEMCCSDSEILVEYLRELLEEEK